jgi:hypothetical protein
MGFLLEQTGTYFAPTALLFGIACLCGVLCLVTRSMASRRAAAGAESAAIG